MHEIKTKNKLSSKAIINNVIIYNDVSHELGIIKIYNIP